MSRYPKTSSSPGPAGVNPALKEDRMPVIRVVNGDTWTLDANLWNPSTSRPATVNDTRVEFILTENRFTTERYWTGTWFEGVYPDANIPGLVHIRVPKSVSSSLRRGVYAFSIRVEDYLDRLVETELIGHFQVEYEPTSSTHNIPYRRNT